MFLPKPGTKQDAVKRWNLSDRAFFGHGACHILAHEHLARFSESGFYAVWIKPHDGYRGNHVFVTDGFSTFDYRGYVRKSRLLAFYWRQYENAYSGWGADLVRVSGNLCDPVEMKNIGMLVRGPDEFLHNATPRAQVYLRKYDKIHKTYLLNNKEVISRSSLQGNRNTDV